MIQDLFAILRIPSVSNDQAEVRRALRTVLEQGQRMGMYAEERADGQVGIVEIGEGPEILGILTHVDVVSAGDLDKWESDPFQPCIRDGKIYARGALDDKGPLIAALYAMKDVLDSGRPLKKKVQMIIGTQEESEWTDIDAYIRSYPLPDYGFTPDGSFPIGNIEKGCADLLLSFPLGEVCENGDDRPYIQSVSGGSASNIVPGNCKVILSNGKILKTVGKAVHSCQPEKGENAIIGMADMLEEYDLWDDRIKMIFRMIKERLSSIYGEGVGLYSENEYYQGEYIHRNVLSPTLIYLEDGAVKLNVNVRTSYTTRKEDVVEAFEKLAAEYGGEITHVDYLPPVFVSRDAPFVEKLVEAYEEVRGPEGERFVLAYGGSYAKAMPDIVSWGPIFPGREDTCHEENEYISVEDMEQNREIFRRAIEKIACNETCLR